MPKYLIPCVIMALALGSAAFKIHTMNEPLAVNSARAAALPALGETVGPDRYARIDTLRQQVRLDAQAIKGASGADLRALYGPPDFVMFERPTTVWQFRDQECVLRVYFVGPDANVMNRPASYFDVGLRRRDQSAKSVGAAPSCAADLITARSTGSFRNIKLTQN